jgi:hypothetical protein
MNNDLIRDKIYLIGNVQVMLDTDLAALYNVKIKRLNEQVRRNIERFPNSFMFQLTESEYNSLRSHFATLDNGQGMHRKYLPYAFTEQGVAMLSGVLKSKTAVRISIQIINAFVSMRKFVVANAEIFHRVDNVEIKQLEHDEKFNEIFDKLQYQNIPEKGIFFDGQVFDAYKFVSDIVRTAKDSIILIDNYVDDTVLLLLTKREKDVRATIYTKNLGRQLLLDVTKHNMQYPAIEIKELKKSHDRFLIIDNKEVYHIGASLKDLGKKWFAFSKLDKETLKILGKLGDEI